jgi:hypothetical protein
MKNHDMPDKNYSQSEVESSGSCSLENQADGGHLKEGFTPIIVCIGSADQYGCNIDGLIKSKQEDGEIGRVDEDINDNRENWVSNDSGSISGIDELSKYSRGMANCTSAVAVGRRKGDSVEVSFLTHQVPSESVKKEFIDALRKKMEELKGLCIDGSVDVTITGGMLKNNEPIDKWGKENVRAQELNIEKYEKEYRKSIESLSEVAEEVFGFQPTIIGPKSTLADSVLFDTQNRRLYLVRPEEKYHGEDVHIYNDAFKAAEFDEMKKKWTGI